MKFLLAFMSFTILFLWTPLLFILKKGFSMEAFSTLFTNQELLLSFMQSLLLALAASIFSTALATVSAFAFPTLKPWQKKLTEAGLVMPMILPEIAFGLAYLVWFLKIGLSLGWTTLLLGHIAFTFCYAFFVMKANVDNVQWSLVDAAKDLGASSFGIFRNAIFPQIAPGIVAAMVMSFTLSLDDFLISFFVKGIDQMTLPIKLYSMIRLGIGPEVYALFVILFCISLVTVLLTQLWQIKSKI